MPRYIVSYDLETDRHGEVDEAIEELYPNSKRVVETTWIFEAPEHIDRVKEILEGVVFEEEDDFVLATVGDIRADSRWV